MLPRTRASLADVRSRLIGVAEAASRVEELLTQREAEAGITRRSEILGKPGGAGEEAAPPPASGGPRSPSSSGELPAELIDLL